MRVQLRDGCMRGDKAGCQALLQQVKANYGLLKSKLEVFMRLEAQRKQLQPACGQ
jgi:histidine-containing phosphotransfer protein